MRTVTGGIHNIRDSIVFARLAEDNTSGTDIIGDVWHRW